MSDIKLIKPKKTLTARERRKKKYDRIGAGLIAGSALGMGAAIIKGTKDKIDKAYGKSDKKKGGGMIKLRGGGAAIRGTNFKGVF